MRHWQVAGILVLLGALCTGCLYSHVRTPLDTDLDRTTLGSKTGESDLYALLWLVSWGDASTRAAAENGNLATVNHMDMEIMSILFGLYYHQTTIVYGE